VETVAFLDYLGGNRSLVYLPQLRRQLCTHHQNPQTPKKIHPKILRNFGFKTEVHGLKTVLWWILHLGFGAQSRIPSRSSFLMLDLKLEFPNNSRTSRSVDSSREVFISGIL
jgi:hypothetical protein